MPRLRRADGSEPGIRRRRAGRGFTYRGPDGRRVSDAETLDPIAQLAIPPAWSDGRTTSATEDRPGSGCSPARCASHGAVEAAVLDLLSDGCSRTAGDAARVAWRGPGWLTPSRSRHPRSRT